jgi:hypothetical protein
MKEVVANLGCLTEKNSKPVVASPNDATRPLEVLACNYKINGVRQNNSIQKLRPKKHFIVLTNATPLMIWSCQFKKH